MATQLKRVETLVKELGSIYSYEAEQWAMELTYGEKMMAGSITRHLRTLKALGKVEHPKDANGKENRHLYRWKLKPKTFQFDEKGNGLLFKKGGV